MRKSPLRALFCLITSLGLDSDRVLDPEGASLEKRVKKKSKRVFKALKL